MSLTTKTVPDPSTFTIVPMSSLNDISPAHDTTSESNTTKCTSTSEDVSGTLSFHNINYITKTRRESNKSWFPYQSMNCFKSKVPKQILFNVSGRVTRGMNAILGPTGCGKSSLLDVLADRETPHSISGPILFNNSNRHPSFKRTVGYVLQDNAFSETLTVRENLFFSANLRLPKNQSRKKIYDRVVSVISELALEHCADQYMGTSLLRGISEGEKKRTAIGMELVLSPKILFLDEPTTGLDASAAYSIMVCLKELSQQGRTVIFSIHQPCYSIFKLFDTVMFMCKGRCLFHGPAQDVISYFSTQGYECEEHDNPADFVLDVLIDANQNKEILSKLSKAYEESSTYKDILILIKNKNDLNRDERSERERRRYKIQTSQSMATEILHVSKRTVINAIRNPQLLFSQIAISILTGLLIGSVFYNLTPTVDSGIQDRLGVIFFIVTTQIFRGISMLQPFVLERKLFIHEHSSGYYKILSFFLAKILCDILLLCFVPSILFSVFAYFMVGFGRTIRQFFVFLLTIFATTVFGSVTSFFIAATIPILGVAVIVAVLILTVMMLFSGFLVHLSSISKWLSWMQWISAFRYASNVLLINEFKDLTFCIANATGVCPMAGDDVLRKQMIDHASAWDLWKYFLGLMTMAATFLILAFIQLSRVKYSK